MESLTLFLFCAALIACLIFNKSIIFALVIGLILFVTYALRKGYKGREVAAMCLSGVKNVKNILRTFVLIGILTAFWRASGTIATIICYSTGVFTPVLFLLMTFLLNTLVSFLTGTSFGSSATIGVICMTMANTMGVSPVLVGGAIMSGSYWGDRCSPVSTSALLVAQVTGTNIFDNIPRMVRSCLVPTIAAGLIYLLIGFSSPAALSDLNIRAMFSENFTISPLGLIPALVILVLSLARIDVEYTMLASIISAIPLCLGLQKMSIANLISTAVFGYQTGVMGGMMDGGGIVSMITVGIIVAISSSYAGIFKNTKLLTPLKTIINTIAEKTNAFAAILCTATLACMIACSQTLATMLTQQLCEKLAPKEELAVNLEDTSILISALVPWCIAAAVPLATVGAPMSALLMSFYIYFVPLWQLLVHIIKNKNNKRGIA